MAVAGYGDTGLMGIRLARAAELSAVQEIDRASAQMFNDAGMPQITRMLWTAEDLAARREAGGLWVITGLDDCPAGFLLTEMVDGCLHIEQVSVDPGQRPLRAGPGPARSRGAAGGGRRCSRAVGIVIRVMPTFTTSAAATARFMTNPGMARATIRMPTTARRSRPDRP